MATCGQFSDSKPAVNRRIGQIGQLLSLIHILIISVAVVGVIECLREGLGGEGAESIAAAVRVVINGITNMTANLIVSGISAFGGVTLIFAVMERQKIKIELQKAKEWTVEELDSGSQTIRGGWTPERCV